MRNFYAKVRDSHEFVTEPGMDINPIYSTVVDDDGSFRVVKAGSFSMQQKIDSNRDNCDLGIIVSRLLAGDTSVVNRDVMFGDFTKFPSSYRDMLQLRIDAEKHFYELPVEDRAKFDYDVNKYIAKAGSEEWLKKLGYVKEDQKVREAVKEVKEEVKSDEP